MIPLRRFGWPTTAARPLFAAAAIVLAAPLLAQAPSATPPAETKPAAPPSAASAPTRGPVVPSKEQVAEGKAAFAKVVAWLGGARKIASVKDVKTKGRLTAKTGDGETTMEVQSAMLFPDALLQEVDSPFGRVAMVVTPTTAFLASSQGTQDLPPPAAQELRRQIQRIPLNMVRLADDPKLSVAAVGKEKVGDVEATVLEITYGSTLVRWFVDPTTGRILRTAHPGASPDGKPVQMVSDYYDYKVIEGMPVAHRLEITSDGQKDQTLLIDEYTFNTGVDKKLFEKPPAPVDSPDAHPAHAAPASPPAPAPTPGS